MERRFFGNSISNLRFIVVGALLLTFSSANLKAQLQEKLDSLLLELPKAKEDSNKVNLLKALVVAQVQTDYKKAIGYATQAEELAGKLKLSEAVSELNYFLGNIYAAHSEFSKAMDCYYKSLEIVQVSGDKEAMASLYNNIASVNLSFGNYPKAIEANLKALKLFEETGNKYGVANSNINIGYVYSSNKDNKTALIYNKKALEIYTEMGVKPGIAVSLNNLGNSYYEIGEQEKSLEYFTRALALYEEVKDPNGIDMALINIAMSNLELREYDKALEYGFKALKVAKNEESPEGISYDYMTLSEIYYRMATNDSLDKATTKAFKSKDVALKMADAYIDSSMVILKDLGMLKEYADAAELASKINKASGNYKEAYEKHELFKTLNDSLFNIEKDKKITQSAMQYDFDKKEAAIKSEQEKKDIRQRNIRNSIAAGLAGALFFLTIVYRQRNSIKKEKKRSDDLLLNILPEEVAEELKAKGAADAKQFDEVTVMFTDFKGFTQISEKMTPSELVAEIHTCFKAFDQITEKYNIEKIKTIGDAYMAAGGLSVSTTTSAQDVVNAALDIQRFMEQHIEQRKTENRPHFEIRIGIHTGPVVAGIVGVKKFSYDIWGDTVNTASRMESNGEAGKVNISGVTYALVNDSFTCIHRGKIQAKGKGEMDMYFVER